MSKTVVETKVLTQRLAALAQLENKSGPEILRDQSRLLLKDMVKLTPPGSASTSESYADQRRRGQAKISKDFWNLWRAGSTLANRMRKTGHGKTAEALEKYIRSGNTLAFATIARDFGYSDNVVASISTGDHDQKRLKATGRAMRLAHPVWVLRGNSIKQAMRSKLADVGTAKGGWVESAQGLGVQLPNWIMGHAKARGVYEAQLSGDVKFILLGNLVDYAQKYAPRIVDKALSIRAKAMAKRIQYLFKNS